MHPNHEYCPQVCATFTARRQAEEARRALLAHGVAPEALRLIEHPRVPTPSSLVLKDIVINALIGAAAGALLAALAQLSLLFAFPALLDAGFWLTLPAALASGAATGAIFGGAAGAGSRGDYREGRLAALVGALVHRGRVVLVARPRDVREGRLARALLRQSLA